MIEVGFNAGGKLMALMTDPSPSIYLDHWALCAVSEDCEYSARLIACVRGSGGTLAVSGFNILEFIRMTDRHQAEQVEMLVESAWPHIVFLDCDAFRVIGREEELVRLGAIGAPHLDHELLNTSFALKPSSPTRIFTTREMFSAVVGSDLDVGLDRMCDTITERVEALRSELATDLVLRRNMEAPLKRPEVQRARHVLREMVRNHLRDNKTTFDRNHAMDLMHTVVPVSYCSMVLLDRHWCTRVDQARKRIRDAGLTFPMAECWTGGNRGVERFLIALEQRVSTAQAGTTR